MFDVGWSELLVIGAVALIVVGPKELPALLRTVGKYLGMIKRQANEFRAQFDEAIRESEVTSVKQEFEDLGSSLQGDLTEVERSLQGEMDDVRREAERSSVRTEYEEPDYWNDGSPPGQQAPMGDAPMPHDAAAEPSGPGGAGAVATAPRPDTPGERGSAPGQPDPAVHSTTAKTSGAATA